jgi:hypothetical protein
MSHLSRGKAPSSFPERDIDMDASDWEEINTGAFGQRAAESGKMVRKLPKASLSTTEMSHSRLASASCSRFLRPVSGCVTDSLRPVAAALRSVGNRPYEL